MRHGDYFIGRGRSEDKKDEDSKNSVANPQRPGWKRSAKQQENERVNKLVKCSHMYLHTLIHLLFF